MACHFGERLRERYGIEPTEQVIAEIRNLVTKREHPKRRGKQVLMRGLPTDRRQVWRVLHRDRWIIVIWDVVERRLVTALPPETTALPRRPPEEINVTA